LPENEAEGQFQQNELPVSLANVPAEHKAHALHSARVE